jgi:hypothetical protein
VDHSAIQFSNLNSSANSKQNSKKISKLTGAQIGSIDEYKKREEKISRYGPFNGLPCTSDVCLYACESVRKYLALPLPPPPRGSLTRNIPVYINQSSVYCIRRGDKVRTIVMPGRVISPPPPFPLRAHLHFFWFRDICSLISARNLGGGTCPWWLFVHIVILTYIFIITWVL